MTILILFGLLLAPPQDPPELDVQEAAFRWLFEHHQTDLDPPAAYCLGTFDDTPGARGTGGDADPGEALLARFRGHAPVVRPASACETRGPARYNVIDRATGLPGLGFSIGSVRWVGPERARVRASYRQGGRWGQGWDCTLAREQGRWRVETCLDSWVS